MQEKPEQQRADDVQTPSALDLRDDPGATAGDRRGEWQGYDPKLLTAFFED
jgi:hypothetical protein